MLVELTPSQVEYLKYLVAHKVQEEPRLWLSLNEAYKRFGRSNVERWWKKNMIKKYLRPHRTEVRLSELLKAAETLCDIY